MKVIDILLEPGGNIQVKTNLFDSTKNINKYLEIFGRFNLSTKYKYHRDHSS